MTPLGSITLDIVATHPLQERRQLEQQEEQEDERSAEAPPPPPAALPSASSGEREPLLPGRTGATEEAKVRNSVCNIIETIILGVFEASRRYLQTSLHKFNWIDELTCRRMLTF